MMEEITAADKASLAGLGGWPGGCSRDWIIPRLVSPVSGPLESAGVRPELRGGVRALV